MLNIERRAIVVGNRTAMSKTAGAVLALGASVDICWSTVAAVTAVRRVIRERRRIEDEAATIGENGASAGGPSIKRFMRTKAIGAEGIATTSSRSAVQVKS